MSNCTWFGCSHEASFEHRAGDGEVWAHLCPEHHMLMDDPKTLPGSPEFDPMVLLSRWIKAQGGSQKAAERMIGRNPGRAQTLHAPDLGK